MNALPTPIGLVITTLQNPKSRNPESAGGRPPGLWRMPSREEDRISYGPRQRMAVGSNPLCNYGIHHNTSASNFMIRHRHCEARNGPNL